MSGLGLGFGLSLNTKAAPVRVIGLNRAELEELKNHIDEHQQLHAEALKIELLRVIDALLTNRLPGTDDKRPIVNLEGYKYALENDRDDIEAIRSALLGEFIGFLAAAQAGGVRRKTGKAHFSSKRRRRTRRRRSTKK